MGYIYLKMANRTNHGGKRENSGKRKQTQSHPHADIIQRVNQKAFDQLDELYDIMLARARGVLVAVRPMKKGKNALDEIVWLAEEVSEEYTCKKCGETHPINKENLFLVYKEPPNDVQLKHLHEHLLGRAAAKPEEILIPEINIIFSSDISCDPPKEDETKEYTVAKPLPIGSRRFNMAKYKYEDE